jgi:hypothetical protein
VTHVARELRVEIIGDASSLQKALGKATGQSSRFGSTLKTLGRVAAVGVGAAFAGMAVVVKQGFDEISEGQQVAAQTAAGLKSTGNAANVTAKQIESLAQSISKKTGIDDEAVQASQNMLLTFTAIRNEVGKGNDIFNQTTQAVADMATRMNDGAVPSMEQLSKTSILVGKALNDPIKGTGALSRVGVQFTEGQKKMIKEMVKSGDVMGAQKLIIAELTKEFGGSAQAAGETLPGQLAKARNAFDEIASKIAVRLLPHLTNFLNWVNEHMPQIEAVVQRVADAIAAAFDAIAQSFDKIRGPIQTFSDWLEDNPEKAKILAGALFGLAAALTAAAIAQGILNLAVLANPYVAGIAAIGLLIGALVALYVTNERVHKAVDDAFRKIQSIVQSVTATVRAIWERFGASFIAIGTAALQTVTLAFRNVFDVIRGIINVFAGLFTGDWRRMWTGVKQIFDGMIGNLLGAMRAWAGALLTVARQAGAAIVQGIVAGLARLGPAVAQKFQEIYQAISAAARQAAGWAVQIGAAIVSGILSGIGGLFGALKSRLEGTLRSVLSSLSPFSSVEEGGAKHIGRPLAEGAIRGWIEGSRDLPAKMSEKVREAVEAARTAISEARGVFAAAFGELTTEALSAFDKMAEGLKTAGEKALAAFDLRQATQEAKKRLQELKDDVAEAQRALQIQAAAFQLPERKEGEADEDFFAREAEARQKFNEEQKRLAETLASAEAALEDERNRQRLAKQRAALEQRAAAERKKLDERTELRRRHFSEDLAALQNYANTHALTAEQLNQRLIAIFAKYRVPFQKAAIQLGAALAEGLNEAAVAVGAAAQKVRNEIMRHLSNIQVRVNVDVVVPDKPDRDVPGRQHGGSVKRGFPYIVGEDGPELFVPRSPGTIIPSTQAMTAAGVAGGGLTINIAGSVVTERQLIDTMREGMLRIGLYNSNIFGERA